MTCKSQLISHNYDWRLLLSCSNCRATCDELREWSMCNAFNGDQINLSVVLIKRWNQIKVAWCKSLTSSLLDGVASNLFKSLAPSWLHWVSSCFNSLTSCSFALLIAFRLHAGDCKRYSRIRNCDLMRLVTDSFVCDTSLPGRKQEAFPRNFVKIRVQIHLSYSLEPDRAGGCGIQVHTSSDE